MEVMGRLKRIKEHTTGAKIILGMGLISIMLFILILSACNTGRPLLNQPQFGLYDSDGRYVIAYPYAHNPKKLMFIPFIDPDYLPKTLNPTSKE
jgi:hypothetical protein